MNRREIFRALLSGQYVTRGGLVWWLHTHWGRFSEIRCHRDGSHGWESTGWEGSRTVAAYRAARVLEIL